MKRWLLKLNLKIASRLVVFSSRYCTRAYRSYQNTFPRAIKAHMPAQPINANIGVKEPA